MDGRRGFQSWRPLPRACSDTSLRGLEIGTSVLRLNATGSTRLPPAFAVAVGEALPRVRDATAVDPKTVRDLVRGIDVAHGLEPRIEILFGPNSKPTHYARSTIIHLRAAATAVQAVPPDSTQARKSTMDADDDLRRFAAHSHAVITKTKPADPPTHDTSSG